MIDAIISRESIRIKAQREHARGFRLEDCPFNETSEATKDWREEWARVEAERRAKSTQAAA
jgi:hypothetical protein